MGDKLRSMISSASERIQAAENEREAARRLEEKLMLDDYAERFKKMVQAALGSELLDALGSVTFDEGRLEPSMIFHREGREFRLKTVGNPPGLTQLEEVTQGGYSYTPMHPQINLVHQANAKDIFLDTLGKALRKRQR